MADNTGIAKCAFPWLLLEIGAVPKLGTENKATRKVDPLHISQMLAIWNDRL